MAHIRRHPVDGTKWQVRYRDPSGKERSRTFPRRVEAERYLINVESQKLSGEWINPDLASTKYGEWATTWMKTRSHLKPKTMAGYEELSRNLILPTFGNAPLRRIDSLMIESWLSDLKAAGRSASRIRQAFFLLSSSLGAAVRGKWLSNNPTVGIKIPRVVHREMLFLVPEQVAALAAAGVKPRYRALILVLAYGGLLWGEAAGASALASGHFALANGGQGVLVGGQRNKLLWTDKDLSRQKPCTAPFSTR